MNYTGILIGIITFLLIDLFHPIVIKAEYYFSKKVWPFFAVVGVTCLWSIKELFEQEERVKKVGSPITLIEKNKRSV